jgi:hypothetical protein
VSTKRETGNPSQPLPRHRFVKRLALAVVAVTLLAAACGDGAAPLGPDAAAQGRGRSSTSTTDTESDRPPDLRVATGDTEAVLSPYSYCWFTEGQGLCADGIPEDPLPTIIVSGGSALDLEFPLDWQLTATLSNGGDQCDGLMVATTNPAGALLEQLGPAGTYRVDVFGRGIGGDAAWAFQLVTKEDHPSLPAFWQAFWSPGESELDATAPFSASVQNIATQPIEVSASAVASAATGAMRAFDLSVIYDDSCWGSRLDLAGPDDFTAQVIELGPAPYEVIITVTIDGMTITTSPVRWPDDFPAGSNESGPLSANSSS